MTRSVRVLGLLGMAVGISLACVSPAWAQSAADKATARQLATDGIQLFQKERFADALDKLERAEALFDAPVHLLYIARCHAKLNHLVEAAEAYRRLVRSELPVKAPQTFKDAVADGQRELPDIEPKIPTLRVDVTPANAKDLRLTIDGEDVSTAVIGVDRPVNPGAHVVEVTAAGRSAVSQKVDVAVAAKQVVKLQLPRAAEGEPGAVETGSAVGASPPNPSNASNVSQPPAATSAESAKPTRRRVRIIGGLDGAGLIPFGGKLDNLPRPGADDRSVSDRFGIGGGGEARLGVSIPVGQLSMTPLLFLNAFSHVPGALYNDSVDRSFNLSGGNTSVMKTVPSSAALGIGVRFDTAPERLQLGGFGELGLLLRQAYSTKATWTVQGNGADAGNVCKFEEQFNGAGLRLRGGVMLPVADVLSLTASAGISLVKISESGVSGKSCTGADALAQLIGDRADVPSSQQTIHAILGLGLGAEFGVGL